MSTGSAMTRLGALALETGVASEAIDKISAIATAKTGKEEGGAKSAAKLVTGILKVATNNPEVRAEIGDQGVRAVVNAGVDGVDSINSSGTNVAPDLESIKEKLTTLQSPTLLRAAEAEARGRALDPKLSQGEQAGFAEVANKFSEAAAAAGRPDYGSVAMFLKNMRDRGLITGTTNMERLHNARAFFRISRSLADSSLDEVLEAADGLGHCR